VKKVLVVEDDKLMRDLLETLLGLEGYHVNSAADLDGIEELIESYQPDFVLVDINLQGQSGLKLIRQIRANRQKKKMIIIAQSGMDEKELALNSGADSFLLKPYESNELIRILKEND